MSFMKALQSGLHWLSGRTKCHLLKRHQERLANPQPRIQLKQETVVTVPKASCPPQSHNRAKEAQIAYGTMMNEYRDLTAREKAAETLQEIKKQTKLVWIDLGLPMHTTNHIKQFLAKAAASKQPSSPQPATRADVARGLFEAGDYAGLIAYKKRVKLSFFALGFRPHEIDTILSN